MEGPDQNPLSGHVIVFGFQGVARRIVRHLINAGQQVIVIEPKATVDERADLGRWGATYVEGSGGRESTLRRLNIDSATAVLCVNDDDLQNIEVALLVREISATIRIVVYATNAAVGRAMQAIAEPGAVLDVAQLASSSFLDAAVRRNAHAVSLGGEEFIIATVMNETSGRIRSIWGHLAPVAVRPADGTPTIVCPGRDLEVEAGDLVTLIGTAADYDEVRIEVDIGTHLLKGTSLMRRMRDAAWAMQDAVDRPFKIAFAILAALGVVSVIVLTVGYRESDGTTMNAFDALYFTSETIATVGFGDFYFRDQSTWLRLWAVVLILAGATLVAVTTALLTNALVGRGLAQSLGRQQLTRMRDHIIIIGLGSVGSQVAIDLHDAEYEVAVIERNDDNRYISQMRTVGIPVLIGDATLPGTLAAAGVDRAAGIAILTSDDLVNIETGLAVRDATIERDIPIALRIFERDLARVVGRSLDAGLARSTAELAAPWFVGAALGLEVLGTFYVGQTPFLAAQLTVRAGGGLDGISMQDLASKTRVVAIRRVAEAGKLEHPPRRETAFQAGDTAFLIGQYEELLGVLQRA